ncbi:hypothetical protein O181_073015 [Austropuccinia psidii MF-1]|uniref:Uncharacterized protein n=1 Tax=Austropuccinia psidii MF-1 TaxID=1389203 RepID=A0A9Q3F9Q8_9BASI|nr:hypothetical protein [Austropuccinia psidii MF-1]
MDQVLQRHKLLKDVFQWRMDNGMFNLASHWQEPRSGFQKICLRDIIQIFHGNNKRMEFQEAVLTPGGNCREDKGESSQYPRHRRMTESDREYSDSFRLTRSKPTRLPSGFITISYQNISEK